MCRKCTHAISPHTKVCSTKVNFKLTEECLYGNEESSRYNFLISYFNVSEFFIINTNDSNAQLRGLIIPNVSPISFHLCKLNPALIHFTTTEI